MKNKRIWAAGVIGVIVMLGLSAVVLAMKRAPLTGKCLALSQIPWFGAELPTRNLGQVQYVAERKYHRVFARVNTTSEEFEKLASELKLSVIRYQMGFDAADIASVDKDFRPVGTKVSCAFGAISQNGRTTVRLFFEPTSDGSTNGVLYVHIS